MPDPDPNPNPNPNPSPNSMPPEPETFSKDYVRELRAENKGWRQKADEHVKRAEAAEAAAKKAAEDAQAAITEANTKAEQRVIRSELKAAAIKAGMVDLDGLKLADLSSVKLNEDGEVEGAEALMETLKKSKPYLFGAPSSSTPGNPPKPSDPKAKKATEMTDEEYAAAKAQLLNS